MGDNSNNQGPEINNQEVDLQQQMDLSLLRINSFDNGATHSHVHPPCTSCGCTGSSSPSTAATTTTTNNNSNNMNTTTTSMKRPSPESTPANEPKPKKILLQQQDINSSLLGFSKISLPFIPASNPTRNPSVPVLRRCISDPYPSPTRSLFPDSSSGSGSLQQSPPDSSIGVCNQDTTQWASSAGKGRGSSALPPLPRTLGRSISDPTPSPAKMMSRSSSSAEMMGCAFPREESPEAKRLKRMKECMRQMRCWWDVCLQDDDEASTAENNNPIKALQVDSGELESEEAVSVEKAGESLIIHFKCPCSKSYQILLSGKNCYYKLL